MKTIFLAAILLAVALLAACDDDAPLAPKNQASGQRLRPLATPEPFNDGHLPIQPGENPDPRQANSEQWRQSNGRQPADKSGPALQPTSTFEAPDLPDPH